MRNNNRCIWGKFCFLPTPIKCICINTHAFEKTMKQAMRQKSEEANVAHRYLANGVAAQRNPVLVFTNRNTRIWMAIIWKTNKLSRLGSRFSMAIHKLYGLLASFPSFYSYDASFFVCCVAELILHPRYKRRILHKSHINSAHATQIVHSDIPFPAYAI